MVFRHGQPPDIPGLVPLEVIGSGSGGSGTVWRCLEARFDRHVAVKLVDVDERTERQFEKECLALGRISSHPHILPVYAGGLDAIGRAYSVMPFASNGSLAETLEKGGALPPREAAAVGRQAR